MILTELIGSVHTFIAALYYSLVNTKNIIMAIWMYKQLQIPSVKTFNSFATLEKKGRIPVLIFLICHCLATSWNHHKQHRKNKLTNVEASNVKQSLKQNLSQYHK